MELVIEEGESYPLGATWSPAGTNFVLYSVHAQSVDLCLFDNASDIEPAVVLRLPAKSNHRFHGYVRSLRPGQLYGYRVHGRWSPRSGHFFNRNKLLLDPYAKAITGSLQWNTSLYGHKQIKGGVIDGFDKDDNAASVPRSIVTGSRFQWDDDKPPNIPWQDTVIYELHVKGFSQLQTQLPTAVRGTFAGIADPVNIAYFKKLGITAIELMPVHYFVSEKYLVDKGLSNYWGYNTIGFFAPHENYAQYKAEHAPVAFRQMVKALHQAGIEVIMDVVFNHTGEGDHSGPLLCFRGIDNTGYYRLTKSKKRYKDYTGTGNTLNTEMPAVVQLIMDSLRYWVAEMHVDGFRFDLAPTLSRSGDYFDNYSSFLTTVQQDPVISTVKLIAEPWDVGKNGYQVGGFPAGWSEWNGKYRDALRDYWRGANLSATKFIHRFAGSPDIYAKNNRWPYASINFITAHDGFTLHDLVTYKKKNNEYNKTEIPDGAKTNRSVNWGIEGETTDPYVMSMRAQHKRNLLASLLLSHGVPMLYAGDELGNSQHGNNNAYCQDNDISWITWQNADKKLTIFTSLLITLRKKYQVFSRLRGTGKDAKKDPAVQWFLPGGRTVTPRSGKQAGPVAALLGEDYTKQKRTGDKTLFIILNNALSPVKWKLPDAKANWRLLLDTAAGPTGKGRQKRIKRIFTVPAFSVQVLVKAGGRYP